MFLKVRLNDGEVCSQIKNSIEAHEKYNNTFFKVLEKTKVKYKTSIWMCSALGVYFDYQKRRALSGGIIWLKACFALNDISSSWKQSLKLNR